VHILWSSAACEVFATGTRRYEKPAFDIESTIINGEPVRETIIWERPFCRLLHFERQHQYLTRDPKVVIVAPLAGHYATLLRDTVEGMLPKHDVYITDWSNARDVPLAYGQFGLDDYIDYIMSMLRLIGPHLHIVAVCQPSVPVLAAVSLMEENEICGVGQTESAHGLCCSLPPSMREHYVQPEAGHYGIFSGSRFRREIVPRIGEFLLNAEAAPQSRSIAHRHREPRRRIFADHHNQNCVNPVPAQHQGCRASSEKMLILRSREIQDARVRILRASSRD